MKYIIFILIFFYQLNVLASSKEQINLMSACLAADQSIKENTVTLRDRDSQDQDRVAIENLATVIQNKIDTYS